MPLLLSPAILAHGLRRFAVVLLLLVCVSCGGEAPVQYSDTTAGAAYAHVVNAKVPWSIHVVRLDRADVGLALHSIHAQGGALGLETLSRQIQRAAALGSPVAAINGDFYQRDRAFAGDPRGLQIAEGELLSAPSGGVSFWLDPAGLPRADVVSSQLQVVWPDGSASPVGLNEERKPDALVLYTPALGVSTHSVGGREFVLQPERGALPLRAGATLRAQVREVRDTGDTALAADTLVLSAGPAIVRKLPRLAVGTGLTVSTATQPELKGTQTAIGGGPVLVQHGRALKVRPPKEESFEFTSMVERHPRTALGWNREFFFLVEVDGRQNGLSVGMTLDELAVFLKHLGCDEAMNLDGGGSSTLWFDGRVRNRPCDGGERPIANALLVTRRPADTR
jgi:large repetitive protein